jgi:hypothetical protein
MTSRPAPGLGPSPATPGTPSPVAILFTLGYEKRDLDAYLELLTGARVGVLVDVRETAWSYKPGFSRDPLRHAVERAGIAYEHAAFAGNPKALRASAPTHAACLAAYGRHLDVHPGVVERLDALLADHAAAGRAACLTCFERHPDDCHRAILAARWVAAAPAHRASTHLAPDGCPRLVRPGTARDAAAAAAAVWHGVLPAGVPDPRGARMSARRPGGRCSATPAAGQTTLW